MNEKEQIRSVTTIKIIVSILCITFGVLSLIFLWGQDVHYTIYVSILMGCIAIASLLLLSSGVLGILWHRKVKQEKINSASKWIYVFSSGVALLILSPLVIIFLSAYDVSFLIFLPCFFIAVSLSVIPIVIGIVKCINVCREPLEQKYILFQGENCPCKKINCKYHGDCTACMAHHHNPEHKTKTECDRLKAKMERQRKKGKAR